MTLKSILSTKRPFSTWMRIFLFRYLYFIGLFSSRLHCIWAYWAGHFWLYST